MVFAFLFSRLMTILLISSIFFILLCSVLLILIKFRAKREKVSIKCFSILLHIVLVLNIIILLIPLGFKIADLTYKDDDQLADERLEQVIEVLQNKDKDSLKAMFSKQAVNEAECLDDNMDYLINLFQGKVKSWKNTGVIVSESNHYGHKVKEVKSFYSVDTDKQKYLIFILAYTKDTDNPDNVGLYALRVIKYEDEKTQFENWQDMKVAGIYNPFELD